MKQQKLKLLKLCALLLVVHHGLRDVEGNCDRAMGMTPPKTPGSGKFEILINGVKERYLPGSMHTGNHTMSLFSHFNTPTDTDNTQ